jgi:hypothetical protein
MYAWDKTSKSHIQLAYHWCAGDRRLEINHILRPSHPQSSPLSPSFMMEKGQGRKCHRVLLSNKVNLAFSHALATKCSSNSSSAMTEVEPLETQGDHGSLSHRGETLFLVHGWHVYHSFLLGCTVNICASSVSPALA